MVFLNLLNYISSLAKKYFYFLFFLIIGLLIFCYPMLKTNFDLMPGDNFNFLYNCFVLEHSFLWINKIAPHFSFWSAPVYYPNEYSLAYSDSLSGLVPFYYLIRIFIKNPLSAYQGLFILLCILNFSSFYYFLKKLNYNNLSSSLGAFIFAFNILRFFNIGDISCQSQFLSILSIIFLLHINKNNTSLKNHFFFLLSAVFIIFQFYTSFAIGFYSLLCGLIAFLLAFLPKSARDCVCSFLKNHYKLLIFYLFIVFLMLLPMGYYHSITGQITEFTELMETIFDRSIWIRNVSYIDTPFYKNLAYVKNAQTMFSSCSLGIFATIFGLFGLFCLKKKKGTAIMLLILIFILSSGITAINCYKFLYLLALGSEGLDSINKIGFIALILIAIGISQFSEIFKNKKFIFFVILLIILETIPRLEDINSSWCAYGLSKTKFENEIYEIVQKIPRKCEVFELKYSSLNEDKHHKNDIEIKKFKAQNKVDIMAFYITLQTKFKTSNKFWKIKKDNNFKDSCIITQTIDFNKI